MRLLDRYVIREAIAPFFLALAVFTFVLAVNPMLDRASDLLAKNVPMHTVGYLLILLLPQALGVTIPMAFLTGLLIALGRLSGDRESVALLACGVSPQRMLRPLLAMAVVVAGADLYIMLQAIPDANQRFREITFSLLSKQSEQDIKPRVFFERFPGLVLYASDSHPGGGWSHLFIADTSVPSRPAVTLAERGRLLIDREQQLVYLVLDKAQQFVPGNEEARVYTWATRDDLRVKIDPQVVFGSATLTRGLPELRIPELLEEIERKRAVGDSPHQEIIFLHQRFSFPVACFVFALLALPLGLSTRKDGKLAGLTLGLLVVLAYYGLMIVTEGWVKGEAWTRGTRFPPEWARWVPNIVLGLAGLIAIRWRARSTDGGLTFSAPGWLTRRFRHTEPPGPTAPAGSRRVVVVIRVPHFAFPAPRLLDRYVAMKYLRLIGLSFTSLLAFFYVATFLDLSEKLFKGQASGGAMLAYLWYSTPQFVAFVLPIATLVAVLATMGGLARTGELTVMRACGISLYRAAAPLLAIALVWSGVLFGLEDRVLAQSNRRAQVLEDSIRGRAPHTYDIANASWLADLETGRIYYYAHFEAARDTLYNVSVFDTATGPYRLLRHTYAATARHDGGAWEAREGRMQTFTAQNRIVTDAFARKAIPLAPIDDFRRSRVDPSLMTVRELGDYVREQGQHGYNVAEQRVDLHRKAAFPAVTLVMTLLAVPFGVLTGRRGALYAIGLAIVLAFAYWLLTTIFLAIGTAGLLPAAVAAWSVNILFLIAAAYLMLTVRT
jgi:LPS export ABC transporter permease LptG/LPS export ABC transporter permease LptF